MFANLSNHPASTWPSRQLDAAAQLGFGAVVDLSGQMPQVPPEASTDDVVALAHGIVAELDLHNIGAAHVAGEYTLTLALVALLQWRGVECFVATSRRRTTEDSLPDGRVRRRSEFCFTRWRKLPSLASLDPH